MEWSAPIRRLGPADLKACLALAVDREWPAEEHKWTLLLEAAEAYGVDDPSGGLAGAVVLGRYGAKLASVGMMLVASQYGRRGLGRRLMSYVLGQAGDASVFLFATSHGRPLYERLGFRTTGWSAAFAGLFQPTPCPASRGRARGGKDGPDLVRDARAEDLAAIVRIDRPAFGADRAYIEHSRFCTASATTARTSRNAVSARAVSATARAVPAKRTSPVVHICDGIRVVRCTLTKAEL